MGGMSERNSSVHQEISLASIKSQLFRLDQVLGPHTFTGGFYNVLMCSNYRPAPHTLLEGYFHVAPPDSVYREEAFPGYMAPIIRRRTADAAPNDWACANAMFGMVPHWADVKLSRQTYNARSETVASKPSFRSAWKHSQFCLVPVASFYEPSYETGKAVRWEIAGAHDDALGVAGIWEYRKDGPNGLPLLSFSMLTVNADEHPLMRRFHKPDSEKRTIVILPEERYGDWLSCSVEEAEEFLIPFPAERLKTHAAPRTRNMSDA